MAKSQLLSLGVPVLNIPLFREQQLFSQRAESTGACLTADRHDLDEMIAGMNLMAADSRFARQAKAFAASQPVATNGAPLIGAIEHILQGA